MKIKFLSVLCLSVFLFLSAACGGKDDANNANANTNKAIPTASPTPIAKTSETAATNPALQKTIEDALKAKGFTKVTVDTTTTPATLRGTYPKGKLTEVIQTAQVANGNKPLQNQMTEEK